MITNQHKFLCLAAIVATAAIMITACGNSDKNAQSDDSGKSSVTTRRHPQKRTRAAKRRVTNDKATSATMADDKTSTAADELTSSPEELAAALKSKEEARLAAEIQARPKILTSTLPARVIIHEPPVDPVVEAEKFLATLPPLPPPTFDLNTTLSQEQWKTMPTDAAVSQANAKFRKLIEASPAEQPLNKEEYKATANYLRGYMDKLTTLNYDNADFATIKDKRETMSQFVIDASTCLEETTEGKMSTEQRQRQYKQAAGYLKQAEALARASSTK